LNFGFTPPGDVRGTVYNDVDGNGSRNSSEPAIPGAFVYVDSNNDGSFQPGEPHDASGSLGQYLITNVLPGSSVVVRQNPPNGFSQITR
jgi:hypothetical protein